MTDPLLWSVALGVLGAIFGSFIATVAIRWPERRSALTGRSSCDDCGAGLRAWELVPIGSFVAQRGRCRRCGATINPVHPLIELTGAALGAAAGFAAPGWEGVAGAVFGWLLLTLAALDYAALWLPNVLTGALALAGVATGVSGLDPPLLDRAIGGVAGFGVLWGVAALYRIARGREGLGGGDPKLFGAIGLWLGWRALPLTLLIACLFGLALVLALRLAGRQVGATDRLPFGVMLAGGAWTVWLGMALAVRPVP